MHRWKLAAVLICFLGTASYLRADTGTAPSNFELYCWKAGNDWDFSLLPASKSRKLDTEIKHGGGPLRGTDKVKEKLLAMKEGDSIAWQERTESGFIIPPGPVMEEIDDYAKSVGVKVIKSR